ncbi:acyl carrier protein, partial [Corallococcus exiguus]
VPTLRNLFEELSGLELADADPGASFLELGLDSLVLTQAALAVQKQFGVKVTFRQLLEEVASLGQLAAYLDGRMPQETAPAPVAAAPAAQMTANILGQPQAAPSAGAAFPAQAMPAVGAFPAQGAPAQFASAGAAFQAQAMAAPAGTLQALVAQQLWLMTQQLALLSGQPAQALVPQSFAQAPAAQPQAEQAPAAQPQAAQP